ncbi:hypothetical protein K458DRAFT_292512 [Lentithecium fluviatile CBS 122367]|uniref:Cyanovirin-N domain-containing protein n=1 Tax=Lentithecium fluviatile CBS 122367 TaxID=1168545 RepID=A0A6G1JCS5_9PLEO|nr:hypothetical protein K458DRAFT_292512 [Lentithecium fluviatile CBS 122367]
MQFKSILLQIAFASVLSRVSANCQLKNEVYEEDNEGKVETNDKLCKPQGEGAWTFAMEVSETGIPVFNGDNAFAGINGNKGFAIYDHTCALRGLYDPGNNGNDCGIPYVMMENFLQWVLTVKEMNADVGGSYFKFAYGDGEYSINNNHCDCVSEGSGTTALDYCKCAFPINGDSSNWSKRGIEFKA